MRHLSMVRTLVLAGSLTLLGVGCCGPDTETNDGKAVDTFRAQGTPYIDGSRVQVTARITPEQAQAISLAMHPGTVYRTELGSENAITVYAVHIVDPNGSQSVAMINADSGAILRITSAASSSH